MQGIFHHTGRRRLALVMLAGGLTAACSTYHPLNRGSDVPWAKASRMATADGTSGGAVAPAAADLPEDRYVVRRGDRLASVAAKYGVSVEALAEANRLKTPDVIYVGQVLSIPDNGQDAAAADVQVADLGDRQLAGLGDAPPAGPADAPVVDEPPAAGPAAAVPAWTRGDLYVVRRGESLWSISRRVDVSMVELAAANRIGSPYDVFAGQKLRIPDPGTVGTVALRKVAAHRHADGEPPALSGRGFLWPVNGKVIGGFGRTRQGQRRDGIDIAAREGAPVLAAEDGIVAYAGDGVHGYGRLILLRHGDGYITTYAHNAALLVEAGELVERGQVIARVGSTGDATRSLLHFELRKGRKPIDPETVLVREGTTVASTE
jgi:murein DD-endopeptidase MepM/ murein hydrolase activator NlpD